MRSPLTQTFKRVQQMIDHVRENLDDEEYNLFCDLIAPEPELQVEKPKPRKPKKILHCDACDYTKRHQVHKDSSRSDYHEFVKPSSASKSRRAKGIAAALNENLQQGKEVRIDNELDIFEAVACTECAKLFNHNIHHLATYPDYHEFVEGKSHALAAGEGS